MAGISNGQAAVITRDRLHAVDVWRAQPPQRPYLLETNYDHWVAPPASDDRRDPGMALMNQLNPKNYTAASIGGVMNTFPVLNSQTT